MKKFKVIKKIAALFIILSLFSRCGVMGEQAANWESGMFSPDGKYYVYTYSNMFITQYSKKGGSTTRIGSITYYIQTIDCITGKKLLEKPFESDETFWISNIDGNYAVFQSYDVGQGYNSPAIFDLKSKKMRHTAEETRKLNPTIPMKMVNSYFYNVNGKENFVFEGNDGRKYVINPETGKVSKGLGEYERLEDKNGNCYQTGNMMEGYSFSNGKRNKIFKGSWGNPDVLSNDDFLQPKFLMINKIDMTSEETSTFYDNHFFILSSISDNDKKERLLTMIDNTSLKTKWSIALPQGNQEMNRYNNERFFLKDNQLFLANSTYLMNIDLDKGKIVKQTELFKIVNKEEQ